MIFNKLILSAVWSFWNTEQQGLTILVSVGEPSIFGTVFILMLKLVNLLLNIYDGIIWQVGW